MKLTVEQVQRDLDLLPVGYKTADVDRLIRGYVKKKADVSQLRPYILQRQQLHRIYFFVALRQLEDVEQRMAFIHNNLLFSDWWHTDQLIGFVADLKLQKALDHARIYVCSEDPFVRRWGYVLLISRLCRGQAAAILPLIKNDDHDSVQMAQAWLIAELAVFQPEVVYTWLRTCDLRYDISGKAIQKICDSFRIPDGWKAEFKSLRPVLRQAKTNT